MVVPGYSLRRGTGLDRALLVKFMRHTYDELYPNQSLAHLAQTVEQYFCSETPLWWVEESVQEADQDRPAKSLPHWNSRSDALPTPVACLWLGIGIDQITGRSYPHIFLLYVSPEHRCRGIGSALMQHAEDWAKARGDYQIGLQVFQQNQPALRLYEKLGYRPQSLLMIKPLDQN